MKFRTATVLLLLFFCSSWVRAQDENVPDIVFDTLRPSFSATKIAVDNMKYIGTQYIAAGDSTIMSSTTAVVQNDLDFYSDFQLVQADSFYIKTYEIKELDLLAWQRLGAAYLVRLEAEFPGGNFRARWRLFDTKTQQEIAKGVQEADRYGWRETAHDVSNEIVRTLTGEKGIFRTQIAYIRRLGKAKEVFIADYDGANERQLTKMGTINLSPSFSPTRDEIYFTSYRDGIPQIYKVNISSLKVNKLTSYAGMAQAPAVSPDGNKIACVLTKDGNSEIYVLDTDGKIIKRLTQSTAIESAPTWSPDGRLIAFSSDRSGSPQIYIMDADGFNQRRLTYQGKYNDSPIWSSRRDRITFVTRTDRGFNLASIDTSGADSRVMTSLGQNENPHFSPDGKQIIFTSDRLGSPDIYESTVSGSNQRRVTRSGDCSNPTWGPMR